MADTPGNNASSSDVTGAIQQQSASQAPPAAVAPCPLIKTWVEFVLLDMEGNPVSGQPYKVGLPDGTIKRGTLDGTGKVRVEGIAPGTCTISYTDLDQEGWERI
jgi:hypothetical protein